MLNAASDFLAGGGEAGALMRSRDWSSSPLGPPEEWPAPLKTLASVMLGSRQPMFIAWGPERIMLYNDGYAPMLGQRHPVAMGQRFEEVWFDILDTVRPILDRAYAGESTHMDDIMFVMHRHGYPEETHFAFSYTPVRDEQGVVAGMFCVCQETTEQVRAGAARVRAEQELRASEERYRQIVEGTDDFAILTVDDTGIITSWNKGAERLTGYTAEDAIGASGDIIFPPEARAADAPDREMNRAQSDGRAVNERWHERKDGSRFWGSGLMMRLDAPGGGFLKIFRDRTAEHEAEAALRESEARLRALTDHLPGGMVYQISTGADGRARRFLYVSQSHEQLTGIPAEAVLADPTIPYQLIHPDDRDLVAAAETEAISARSHFDVEARFRRADGETRWCRIISAPREQEDGSLIWDGIQVDITERKEKEAALRLRGEEFYALADNIPTLCWIAYADGHIFWYNRRWYEYTGTSKETQEGWGWESVHDPEMLPQVAERWKRSLATGEPFEMTFPLKGADGIFRPFLTRIVPIRDEAGQIVRWFGTNADISAQVENERELERQVAERTRERDRTWALSQDLMAVAGFDGRFKAVNPAFERMLGYKPADLLERPFAELIHPDDLGAAAAVVARLQADEPTIAFEDRLRHADGSWRWIEWTAVPEGELFYATGRDVTAQKEAAAELQRAQEQLRQSQKMEAIGQLTGGVAHDFNNLLTPIIGSLDLLQRRGLGGERERRLIDGALQSGERAKTLVQRLLAFARRQPLQASAVDVAGLVNNMADLIASTSGPKVQLVVDLAPDLPAARADPNQLEMAILNLSVNARDAMPDGGRLTISAAAENVAPGKGPKLQPGCYIRLTVADTGAGMDEATLARAIEPFFSTKGVGKGTGLGLSMVHGLASQLGGALTISSKPGLGTKAELWLPASAEPAAAGREEAEAAPDAAGAGKVLLVDDEELVRMSTADMLDDLGYAVTEAGSAEEALRLLDGGLDPDVLVTDHMMPGLTGAELARKVRERLPGTAVLIVSGYADAESLAPDLPRLTKPFRQTDLAASLAELTEA